MAAVLRCASDMVLLSSGACSGRPATIRASPARTLGLGAGRAAADCAAVAARAAAAARSVSAAALCDDRTCCSELLRSVIRAVGTIERFERDPDDSSALWVVPAFTKA